MKKSLFLFVFWRVVIGAVFVVSGFEKLIQPRENFLYVIHGYNILPHEALAVIVATTFPWIEFLLGSFLILGLWTRIAAAGVALCNITFIIVVGQALVRKLPISECGCFGDLLKLPLAGIIVFDTAMLVITTMLFVFWRDAAFFGLDEYFRKAKE